MAKLPNGPAIAKPHVSICVSHSQRLRQIRARSTNSGEQSKQQPGNEGCTRREREDTRQAAYEKIVNTAEEELVGIREEALQRVPDLAKKVMDLFMPRAGTAS